MPIPHPKGSKAPRCVPKRPITTSEFVLPYEAIRQVENPDEELMLFLQSTYDAAADLSDFDRAALERPTIPSAGSSTDL